jgi:protein-S-isoprenylcysteine O-methyltransferase Ste14
VRQDGDQPPFSRFIILVLQPRRDNKLVDRGIYSQSKLPRNPLVLVCLLSAMGAPHLLYAVGSLTPLLIRLLMVACGIDSHTITPKG